MVDLDWYWGDLLTLIVSIIGLLIQIPLLLVLITRLTANEQQKPLKTYKYCAIIAFIFAILTSIGQMFQSLDEKYEYIGDILGDNAPIGVSLSTYIFLLLRLHFTFRETRYRTKRCIIYMHTITFILLISMAIIPPFIEVFIDINELIEDTIWCILLSIAFGQLLYQFNHNLFLLALSQRQTISLGANINYELNQRQIRLLTTMRKHTILGCVMMISNLMYAVANLLLYYGHGTMDIVSVKVIFVLHLILWFIFANGCPLAIFLGFGVNVKLYFLLFRLCDKKCGKNCQQLAEEELNGKRLYVPMDDAIESTHRDPAL